MIHISDAYPAAAEDDGNNGASTEGAPPGWEKEPKKSILYIYTERLSALRLNRIKTFHRRRRCPAAHLAANRVMSIISPTVPQGKELLPSGDTTSSY